MNNNIKQLVVGFFFLILENTSNFLYEKTNFIVKDEFKILEINLTYF